MSDDGRGLKFTRTRSSFRRQRPLSTTTNLPLCTNVLYHHKKDDNDIISLQKGEVFALSDDIKILN